MARSSRTIVIDSGLSAWNFCNGVLRRLISGNSLSDPEDLLIPLAEAMATDDERSVLATRGNLPCECKIIA